MVPWANFYLAPFLWGWSQAGGGVEMGVEFGVEQGWRWSGAGGGVELGLGVDQGWRSLGL